MTVSREIMSIMAGLETLSEPAATSARHLPGKSASARLEAILRVVTGTILPRRLVLVSGGGRRMVLRARSGRLFEVEAMPSSDLAKVSGALVAHAHCEGQHLYHVEIADEDDAGSGVGFSVADLRAACAKAMQAAEVPSDASFAMRLSVACSASGRLDVSGGVTDIKGDASLLPASADTALMGDIAALRTALGHVGGGFGFVAVGAADEGAGRLILAEKDSELWIAAAGPGQVPQLAQAWADTAQRDKG
ncbi:hypothetical protein OEW28_18490 [Defluviimonas sp. WL0002]|uniref:Uncharacterized protein n=1 Tax=Albidovulum marisflavi TaxID=2984159 RepID=A0ABT2ZHJ3_9RHOB|nr:hypothetical protein [Defluviimonas sp. WL0002]MCV2870605.1 hypothetical protein [Defluviimonas sp. WL0002]